MISLNESERFGKYLLLDRIARGGMAELYKAKITGVQGFEKLIAIKKILPHLSEEEVLVTSFIDEAKLAALLHHQNIAQIYDFGSVEDSYYIAMEYLVGKDLGTIVRKAKETDKPLSLEYAIFLTSKVCAGLDYSHNLKDFHGKPLNIIHRDISPQNIFVTYQGEVKIVDFGIAKAATQSTKTQMGMIKGKVAYMSPEQAEGAIVDHRSDIFSTGIVLYELVTGKRMFKGDTLQILSLVRKAEFESPENVREDLPPKLCEILGSALAKEPEKRYRTAGEMLTDLEECIYQLSMRPTTRGLAQHMHSLFEEEIAAEKSLIQEDSQVEPWQPLPADEDFAPPGEKEEVPEAAIAEEMPVPGKRPGILYGALAGFAIVLGVILMVVFKPGSDSVDVPSEPEPSTQTSPAESSQNQSDPVVVPPTPPSEQELASVPAESGGAQIEAGMKALEEERFADAVLVFQEAMILDPSLMDKLAKPYARALEGQARSLAKENPEEAAELLLKSVEYDPESVQGHFQLGLLYVKLKKWDGAIESYQKVAELDPQFPDTYFNLGYVYARVKNYPEAEKMYGRVVELAPPYLDQALFNLALVQAKLGKREQSVQSLEEAIALNPENDEAKEYLKRLREKQ